MARNPYVRDHHTRKARSKGYAARSVFKLDELDRRFKLLRRGARVLDLGCAPGSWSQYAGERVGPSGCVVGVDLSPVTISMPGWVRCVQRDAWTLDAEALQELSEGRAPPFDVVISDMAPRTTGQRSVDQAASAELVEHALGLAQRVLKPNGDMVVKLFQGPDEQRIRGLFKEHFRSIKGVKPEATRGRSFEIFLVARGRR